MVCKKHVKRFYLAMFKGLRELLKTNELLTIRTLDHFTFNKNLVILHYFTVSERHSKTYYQGHI